MGLPKAMLRQMLRAAKAGAAQVAAVESDGNAPPRILTREELHERIFTRMRELNLLTDKDFIDGEDEKE